jgi:hypothetical protein
VGESDLSKLTPAKQTDKVVLSSRQIAWQLFVTLTEAATAAPRVTL